MTLLGVRLRAPGLADLPITVLILVVGIALSSLAGSLAIASGFAGAAIAVACGVNAREHGLRGLLIVMVISVALVALVAAFALLVHQGNVVCKGPDTGMAACGVDMRKWFE